MPSVNVPLHGAPGWDQLMRKRRTWWTKPGNNQISPHFVRAEFDCNDGSTCPINARPAMVKLCQVYLEPLRKKFGTAYVLSGYRHERYNQAIGGALHSQHVYEQSYESVAADVRFAKGTPAQWAAEAKRLRGSKGGGIGRYDRSSFLHVDNRSYSATWSG